MLILHISDIHFRTPHCLNPDMDPDRTFRTRMLNDVRDQVAIYGPIDAILVGGDIAFKADPQEYKAALTWLHELTKISGCQVERLYVVPGNHDIDRGITRNSLSVKNAQAAIKRAEKDRRESVLREQFQDVETGNALLKPLAAYNDFAKLFNCQIYTPDRLYWKQYVPIDGEVKLRINGLTSTILSGINGENDEKAELYLSPLQTGLDPEDNVVNLVIAHHPPDWCLDNDEIEDDIKDRSEIHLFGHKHRQRADLNKNFIRIGAAAVNPDRNEPGFEPGYNLIDLKIVGQGLRRQLLVEAHLRHLQRSPEQYRSRLNGEESIFKQLIDIPDRKKIEIKTESFGNVDVPQEIICVAEKKVEDSVPGAEVLMSQETTRNLVYRFWQLSMSQRREIALGLKLIDKAEVALPEPERYGRALMRAGERNLLDQLDTEVSKREKQ